MDKDSADIQKKIQSELELFKTANKGESRIV